MTRPRVSLTRELFCILGTSRACSSLQASWNSFFATEGWDASMDRYTTTEEELPNRLSEMFHFDRRLALVIGENLQCALPPLLDGLDASVQEGRVDTILNRGGVLTGFFLGAGKLPPREVLRQVGIETP